MTLEHYLGLQGAIRELDEALNNKLDPMPGGARFHVANARNIMDLILQEAKAAAKLGK